MKKPSTMFWYGMGYAFVLFLVHLPCGGEWPHARCFVNPDWDVSRFVQETILGKFILFPYWLLDALGFVHRLSVWSMFALVITLLASGAVFAVTAMLLHRFVGSKKQLP